MDDFEKLGSFYLGRAFDAVTNETTQDLLLYDAKDLTTHAVCVGMTGSGKTGLCVSLLEEAAIDGIPAIAIDPKGDLGNLLLTFPELRPGDFRPWIDESAAARKNLTPDAFAEQTAELWRNGLAKWGQDGARIRKLKSAVDMVVYTPGSNAGVPLTVLRSFDAPPAAVREDADLFRDRISAAASGLLALLGVDGDPIQSREHILVSSILSHEWSAGRSLDLASLIGMIQKPPFDKVGAMTVETFYPGKDRMGLSIKLNNLLASPAFAGWLEGESLDVNRLLYTDEGRPRLAILSIAHLSEAERMFFVTILLNEVLAWVRTQAGTSSLRALLYMDEVFGYFPPVAEPPSKKPMLTLLKQARAYGLGVVLATQNPVDLDYKGLSNTGTWFLGRLQTERDKERVLEGLEGASTAAGQKFDRGRMESILAGLGSRVFLMNNVHEDEPVLFHTRWALSYLAGPITRSQIQRLMAGRNAAPAAGSPPVAQGGGSSAGSPGTAAPAPSAQPPGPAAPAAASGPGSPSVPPLVPPSVAQWFRHPPDRSEASSWVYRPEILAEAKVHYVRAGCGVDTWQTVTCAAPLSEDTAQDPWEDGSVDEGEAPAFDGAAVPGAGWGDLPAPALEEKSYKAWQKKLVDHLYRNHPLTLWSCPSLKEFSKPGESEKDFRIRLGQQARENRDAEKEKLRTTYAPKLERLQEKIRSAESAVDREEAQYTQQKSQTVISMGATILGAVFGRKLVSSRSVGRATTAARGMSRAARERQDVERAREKEEALRRDLQELEAAFAEDLAALDGAGDPSQFALEELTLAPRKSDITVTEPSILWTPWRRSDKGFLEPL